MANAVESSQDSGKWTVGYTTDGLHPNAAGHALIAEYAKRYVEYFLE